MLAEALRYASQGWAVFPLYGKHPLVDESLGLRNGFKDATVHPETIKQWWDKHPEANIGIATGYKFWVLDVDIHSDGPDTLDLLESKQGKLPDTLQQTTGSGGRHFLFRQPGDFRIRNTVGKLGPGLDTRGDGGYIVAPPSVHPETGAFYEWDGMEEFDKQPILDAPLWLLDRLKLLMSERKEPFLLPEKVETGGRNQILFSFASKMRRGGMGYEEILTALDTINQKRVSPPLETKELERIAKNASRYPPGALGTIEGQRMARVADQAEQAVGHPVDDETVQKLTGLEDDGTNHLAQFIMQDHKFLSHAKYLYEYTGAYWKEVEETYVRHLAAKLDRAKETSTARRSAVLDYITDTCYREHIAWNNVKISEVPFKDGVYDIETGAIRAHRPDDFLQTIIPHNAPKPGAYDCSAWLGCLNTYFKGDEDKDQKIAAVQEFMGYCLMAGHARYKKALLLTGDTDCGKSTIPMAIGWLVGIDNCCSVSIEDMDDQKKISPILGKLVNRMGELKSRAAVADGGFKKLVSTGDSVSVEKKYKDIIEYTPVAKHVIATNNLPTVNDNSKATFNRMLLIRFNHSIPKKEQTTDVYDHIKAQIEGLVSWALEGAVRLFKANGKFTRIPESDTELNEYRRKENVLIEFLEDFCVPCEWSSIPRHEFQEKLQDRHIEKYKGRPTLLSRDLTSIGVKVAPARHNNLGVVRSLIGLRFRERHEEGVPFEMFAKKASEA